MMRFPTSQQPKLKVLAWVYSIYIVPWTPYGSALSRCGNANSLPPDSVAASEPLPLFRRHKVAVRIADADDPRALFHGEREKGDCASYFDSIRPPGLGLAIKALCARDQAGSSG